MEITNLLDEQIEREFESIAQMAEGDVKTAAIKNLETLHRLRIEERKLDDENSRHSSDRIQERTERAAELLEERKRQKWELGMRIAEGALKAVGAVSFVICMWAFESDNTIGASVNKLGVQNLMSKLFRKS